MSVAAIPGWTRPESPFHAGELALQRRTGVAEKLDRQGRRAVREFLPDQHREFYALLPFLAIGGRDAEGWPGLSLLAGSPGFVSSPDPRTLRIAARPGAGDPLEGALTPGAEIGVLGLQPHTRRRNRMRGTLASVDAEGLTLDVVQSFGNCPQYIQAREAAPAPADRAPGPVVRAAALDARAAEIIAAADTFWIATAAEAAGSDGVRRRVADASHRGGRPGFVRVGDGVLDVPDFVGNFHFNTLGNLALDPRAGVTFVDFPTGDVVHLRVRAEVIWDGPELRAFAGAERLLRLRVVDMVRRPAALPLAWTEPEFSPILGRTGSWESAAAALEAERDRGRHRPFRVVAIADESAVVRSLVLEPADGGGVIPHAPGQFLPIRLAIPGRAEPLARTYTISDAPNGRTYRLSVKREDRGGASAYLHTLTVGDVIEAAGPRGDFVFDAGSSRPVVLLSAGVGVTPMIAMLNALLVNEGRTRHHAPIHFIHAATNGAAHAFGAHLRAKAALHANLRVHIRYSHPRPEDALGRDHDGVGRIDKAALQALLPLDDYDFYLCGPPGFMQTVYDAARDLGVPDARIRFEAFGPASVKRRRDPAAAPAAIDAQGEDAEEAVEVVLAKSGRKLRWRPADGSLLDLVEAAGLAPDHSCRTGVCGTCAVKVVAGAVQYREPPIAVPAAGEALICCSVPRPGPHRDDGADRVGVTLDL